jgi:hypothetical protein
MYLRMCVFIVKIRFLKFYTFYTVHYGKLLKKRPTNALVVHTTGASVGLFFMIPEVH